MRYESCVGELHLKNGVASAIRFYLNSPLPSKSRIPHANPGPRTVLSSRLITVENPDPEFPFCTLQRREN